MSFKLCSSATFFNPHSLHPVGREAKEIVLFNEKGPIYRLRWFSPNEQCRSGSNQDILFDIPLKRKAKEVWCVDYAYWIPRKKGAHSGAQKYAVLYIPLSEYPVTAVTSRTKTTTYKVEGLHAYFTNTTNMRQTKKNKVCEQIGTLIGESTFADTTYDICNNFNELKTLVAEIDKLDKSVRGGAL